MLLPLLALLQPVATGASVAHVETLVRQVSPLLQYSLAAEQDALGQVTVAINVIRDRPARIGDNPGYLRSVRFHGGATAPFTAGLPRFRGCDGRQLCWYAQTVSIRLSEADLASFRNGSGISFDLRWEKGPADLLSVEMREIKDVLESLSEAGGPAGR